MSQGLKCFISLFDLLFILFDNDQLRTYHKGQNTGSVQKSKKMEGFVESELYPKWNKSDWNRYKIEEKTKNMNE